jgi:hypothetical protein
MDRSKGEVPTFLALDQLITTSQQGRSVFVLEIDQSINQPQLSYPLK